jgi:hypothetical protein
MTATGRWIRYAITGTIYQSPNYSSKPRMPGMTWGGGRDAAQTLAAFVESIADGYPLPKMEWKLE